MATKKELEKEKERLRKQMNVVSEQLNKIQNKENIKEWSKKIGSCYKYRNSYGSGTYWYLYIQIVGVNVNGIMTEQYEIDCYNKISIEKDKQPLYRFNSDYIPISEDEFNAERDRILETMNLEKL